MNETSLVKDIQLAVSVNGIRIFRNNCGRLKAADGRWVQFGLCPGSSDLIGWKSITITREMIGRHVAVFCALEVKTDKGKPTPEQWAFIDVLDQAGGLAAVVRSISDARQVLNITSEGTTLP